ncbi:hypothetical protein [Micromonospora chalcea]|uniref:hypothetical protein n=1 Tax=Micromonospora chalcea TaxID=1874 RepID=UPI0038020334
MAASTSPDPRGFRAARRQPDFRRALDTGDAHAIKFTDTLSDAYARSGDPVLRGVAARSVEQIAAD